MPSPQNSGAMTLSKSLTLIKTRKDLFVASLCDICCIFTQSTLASPMKPEMSLSSYFLLTLNTKILLTSYPHWSFVLVLVPTTTLASLVASRMRFRRSWRCVSHFAPCCLLPVTLSAGPTAPLNVAVGCAPTPSDVSPSATRPTTEDVPDALDAPLPEPEDARFCARARRSSPVRYGVDLLAPYMHMQMYHSGLLVRYQSLLKNTFRTWEFQLKSSRSN